MGHSPFGMRLWRLLSHRRPTLGTSVEQMRDALAIETGIPSGELAAIVEDGAQPSSHIVGKLAPALGIHTADLFVIAGLPVPDEIASAWPTSPSDVGSILRIAVRMNDEQRHQLEAIVKSMPVQPRGGPAPTDNYPDIPGALLLRLLRNRNIRPHNARILKAVGDGPYVSDSTVAGLGTGRVAITPQYVAAFAHLLGYQPGDLVALTGVGPPVANPKVHPASVQIAALAWRARRLSNNQLNDLMATTRTICGQEAGVTTHEARARGNHTPPLLS